MVVDNPILWSAKRLLFKEASSNLLATTLTGESSLGASRHSFLLVQI